MPRVIRDPGPARGKLMVFAHGLSMGSQGSRDHVDPQVTSSMGAAILAAFDGDLDLMRARGLLCEELRVLDR